MFWSGAWFLVYDPTFTWFLDWLSEKTLLKADSAIIAKQYIIQQPIGETLSKGVNYVLSNGSF